MACPHFSVEHILKIEQIGNVTFYPSTFSPEPGAAQASFTTDCETDHYCLLIDLETKDDAQAIERGRRIVQLWQLSEGMASDEKLAAIFQHAEIQNDLARAQSALFDEFTFIVRFWKAMAKKIMGRGRAPDPTLQGGPFSGELPEDKQVKGQ